MCTILISILRMSNRTIDIVRVVTHLGVVIVGVTSNWSCTCANIEL